jgi:putative tricarboxylic transport membrane protein
MSEKSQAGQSGPSHRGVEIGVTVFTFIFGIIVIIGSMRAGTGWGVEGPRAGFFPFYIGASIVIATVVNFVSIMVAEPTGKRFADWARLRQVLSVVIPAAIYVALVPVIGIYVASFLLIGVFMRWLGGYRWALVAAVSIAVPLIFFLVFERWFLIPLPKGPVEEWLGY